jgi:DNA ligase-1
MDGMRAYWNGNIILSRQGKEIRCPSWFIEGLPKGVQLDGELWMGRGHFEEMNVLIHSKEIESWKEVKFVLFDIIMANVPYEIRMEELKRLKLPIHVSVVNIECCLGNEHLIAKLKDIVSTGGEGLVATEPQSFYTSGRTRKRLKVIPTGLFCLQ